MKSNYYRSRNKGFTLIELLVVIAIIGLLSSVVLASLSSARKKAQNTRMYAEVKQAVLAMSLYYDENGKLPGTNLTSRYCIKGSCTYDSAGIGSTLDALGPSYSKYFRDTDSIFPSFKIGGYEYRGVYYRCAALNAGGQCTTATIVYPMYGNGDTDCIGGKRVLYDSNGTVQLCNVNPNESAAFQGY